MYKKIMNTFFNELKSNDLLKLSDDFYKNVKEYLKNLEHDKYNNKTELERIKYYIKELRKLRLYKAFFGNRHNLLEEEKELLKLIEDIEYYDDFKNSMKDKKELLLKNSNIIDSYDNYNYNNQNIQNIQDKPQEDNNKSQKHICINQEPISSKPKPINTQNDIDIVRVITRFPEFTDGKFTYVLNKNDIITLNKKFSKILEKHNIIRKINGEYYEDEKEGKKILSIL
ncbi:hypothetical protein [Methanothermococcus okinawensis]|nr:hypothetical protein [Methanothermococcus okinawensis]